MPGNAYFTRIFSKVVGPKGQVYAFIPAEEIKNCPPAEIAGSRAMEQDPAYRNVAQLSGPVNQFSTPRRLDVLWTAQNYHDLHDVFMGPANIEVLNKAFFNSLKPGGVLIIIDHAAASGSELRDTETLHRIDPASARKEIEAAGFVFGRKSMTLRTSTTITLAPSSTLRSEGRLISSFTDFASPGCQGRLFHLEVTDASDQN